MAWTTRGVVREDDKEVIRAIAGKNKVASRIFVTGEVHESYIGEDAVRFLIGTNDIYTMSKNIADEPLFTETREDTIRMVRFDPEQVWRCINPDLLLELMKEEANRLNLKMNPLEMDHFDFYEAMVATATNEFGVPKTKKGYDINWYYNSVYLTCLLLFRKQGYMDVPVATHFANPATVEHLRWVEYRMLNEKEKDKVKKLRKQYGNIKALTNQELLFVVSLFEKGR